MKDRKNVELKVRIKDIVTEVSHCSQLYTIANTENQKKAYEIKMKEAVDELFALASGQQSMNSQVLRQQIERGDTPRDFLREFTVEELSQYDGVNGRPAYVGVNGNVYDLTNNSHWSGGSHYGLFAGQNHSEDFMICHAGMSQILDQLPLVGKVI